MPEMVLIDKYINDSYKKRWILLKTLRHTEFLDLHQLDFHICILKNVSSIYDIYLCRIQDLVTVFIIHAKVVSHYAKSMENWNLTEKYI